MNPLALDQVDKFHVCISSSLPIRDEAGRYYQLRGMYITHLRLHFAVNTPIGIIIGIHDEYTHCSNN